MLRYLRYIIVSLTFVGSLSASAGSKLTANVKMLNGHEYAGVEFSAPKNWDKEVTVKVDGQKRKIKGDSIDYIVFWPTKFPDNKQVMCWHTYGSIDTNTSEYNQDCGHNSKKGMPSKQWFVLQEAGDYVNLWSCFADIKLSKDRVMVSTSLSCPFFYQKQDGLFVHIPFSIFKKGKTREWLSTFFSDDEVLVELLSDKSQLYDKGASAFRKGSLYIPYKYEDIVKLYVAGRKE